MLRMLDWRIVLSNSIVTVLTANPIIARCLTEFFGVYGIGKEEWIREWGVKNVLKVCRGWLKYDNRLNVWELFNGTYNNNNIIFLNWQKNILLTCCCYNNSFNDW